MRKPAAWLVVGLALLAGGGSSLAACLDGAGPDPEEPVGSEGGLDGATAPDADASTSPSDAATCDAAPPWPPPWDAAPLPCTDASSAAGGTAPVNVAGTRIRPRYLVLDDGTPLLYDLFDTLLAVPCRVRAALGADAGAPGTNGCSMEPAQWCEPIADGVGRACAPSITAPLVAFTDVRVPITPTIDAVVKAGADGSRIWTGELFDREHDAAVSIQRATDLVGARLLPTSLSNRSFLHCLTTPVAPSSCQVDASASGQPQYTEIVRDQPPVFSMGGGGPVIARGAPITTLYCFHLLGGTTCEFVPTPAEAGTWTVGAVVPQTCFLRPGSVKLGSGRLSAVVPTVGSVQVPVSAETLLAAPDTGQASFPYGNDSSFIGLHDGTEPCFVRRLQDGSIRCLPRVGYLHSEQTVFTDPACSQPADTNFASTYNAVGGNELCPLDRPPAIREGSTPVSGPYHIAIGGGPSDGGSCSAFTLGNAATTIHALGPVLDPAPFAQLTLVMP